MLADVSTKFQALTSKAATVALPLLGKWSAQKWQRVTVLAFAVIACYLLAKLFWLLFPISEPQRPDSAQVLQLAPQAATSSSTSLQAAAELHLFGEVGAEPEAVQPVQQTDARETNLQLTLMGVFAGGNRPSAIIEYQNKQQLYYEGEELAVGANVKLDEVHADKVLINNRGSLESLILFTKESLNRSSSRSASLLQQETAKATLVDNRSNTTVSQLATNYRNKLFQNPQSLADVIRVSMNRDPETGQLNGYRIRPGRHRDAFTEFGFKPNDIVTAINSIELNDPSKTMEVYKMLREANEATFNVLRDNQEVTVMVSIGAGR